MKQKRMSIVQTIRKLEDYVGELISEVKLGDNAHTKSNMKGKVKSKYPTTESVNFVKDIWRQGKIKGRSKVSHLQGTAIRRTVEQILEERKTDEVKFSKKRKYTPKVAVEEKDLITNKNSTKIKRIKLSCDVNGEKEFKKSKVYVKNNNNDNDLMSNKKQSSHINGIEYKNIVNEINESKNCDKTFLTDIKKY